MKRLDDAPLLTVTEVARRFGIDHRTLMHLVDGGRIAPSRTLTGQLRFREDDVRKVLEEDEETVRVFESLVRSADAQLARLRTLAEWLVDLDRPGNQERKIVTLDLIIRRARAALTGESEGERRT